MNVFDLVAKISLDDSEYNSGVNKAQGTFSKLASGVGNGLKTVAKVGAAAVSAGAAGVAALTKMGVEGYAQYEQLTGGIETMFEDLSWDVEQYANNAYKSAGLSANAYMETVMGFSAALTSSLMESEGHFGRAADLSNQIITDMADNANKMGSSMESIQNAYSGFAKQNYTMLDNLKLGYGGTKEEMERLIEDANRVKEANGEMADLSIDSFADVTEAIHIIQGEMGITGTTAREAATTIEGSLAMMKGSWENLVVGMADENANAEVLIDNFVESTAMAAQNLMPRIEQTIKGIGSLIENLAPIISDALPVLIESVLPSLLSAGVNLIAGIVSGIITAIPGIYNALLDAIFVTLTTVFGMSEESAGKFVGTIDSLVQSVVAFFQAAFEAVSALFSWLVEQAQTEGTVFNAIWESIKTAVSAAIDYAQNVIQMFTAILKGDWSGAWEFCKEALSAAWTYIKSIFSIIGAAASGMWDGVKNGAALAWEGIKSAFGSVATWFKDTFAAAWQKVKDVFSTGGKVFEGIKDGISSVFKTVVNAIIRGINNVIAVPFNAINNILDNIRAVTILGLQPFSWVGSLSVPQIPQLSTGLKYVPYDEFPAFLHRGEAVLTAAEARAWRNGQATPAMAGGITINQYIQSVPQTPVEMAAATEAYFEQARWSL